MTDPDLIEANALIRALEGALDRANARVREAEAIIATLNERLTTANARCADLEFHARRRQRSTPAAQHVRHETDDDLGAWDAPPWPDVA